MCLSRRGIVRTEPGFIPTSSLGEITPELPADIWPGTDIWMFYFLQANYRMYQGTGFYQVS